LTLPLEEKPMKTISVCEPCLTGKEADYLLDCVNQNQLSSRGRYVSEFEHRFARYCGCCHGVATTSGTTALHLALAASDIRPGDEVLVPAFTMVATVFAVLYIGATPVLVDADPETWNMDVRQIQGRVTANTKAILPVHVYGHPCDLDRILAVAREKRLQVIEDAAEAHGAEYKGRRVGSFGRAGCFSFYANKMITTGEGGMVVTNDAELSRRLSHLKNLAYAHDMPFRHTEIGFNYRMTNLQAAVGLAQLDKIDDFITSRRRHAARYKEQLAKVPGIRLPAEKVCCMNVYWMFGVLVDEQEFGMDRDGLMEQLRKRDIETRPFFWPMHRQPAFERLGLFRDESYPVADNLAQRGLYLPSGSGLKDEEIDCVCTAIHEIQKHYGTRDSKGSVSHDQ
jgi:perosamine synthetase